MIKRQNFNTSKMATNEIYIRKTIYNHVSMSISRTRFGNYSHKNVYTSKFIRNKKVIYSFCQEKNKKERNITQL